FFSDTENWSQVERGEAFTEALRRRGLACEHLRWQPKGKRGAAQDEWQRRRDWLMTRLKDAPKPLAIFAANGTLAVELRELCEEACLHVPTQVAIVGIVGAAQTLVILTAGIDLSVGAIMVLSSVVMGQFTFRYGLPPTVAVLCGLAVGAACGFINGVLVARMKLPPFIVTLGMWQIVLASN
ncbi:substrate-binding domain-containing protein, partial [bacterium]|nr:substrate-binding domain-containing protein [bacterium]